MRLSGNEDGAGLPQLFFGQPALGFLKGGQKETIPILGLVPVAGSKSSALCVGTTGFVEES